MSRNTVNSLIAERARILAMVQFTSRHDLQVNDFRQEGGLDLLVRIVPDDPGYQKFFGVQIKGTGLSIADAAEATRYFAHSKLWGKSTSKYSFPVVVLLFSMEDDKGYFAWSTEPLINRSGEPKLKWHERPSCAPFDRAALETIVNRVGEWHESLVALLEKV